MRADQINTSGSSVGNVDLLPRRVGSSLVAGLLAALVVVASACSSSTSPPATTASTTTAAPTTTSSGPPSLTKIETELASGPPTFLAAYSFSDTVHADTPSGSYVVAQQGSDDLVAVHEPIGKIEQIGVGGKTYLCNESVGFLGWSCIYGPGVQHAQADLEFADIFTLIGTKAALDALKAHQGATTTSTGTVDGHSVACAESTPGASNALTVCVLADGVLAEFESQSAAGTRKVVLTSFSTSVPSGEFTLPAKPQYLCVSCIQ